MPESVFLETVYKLEGPGFVQWLKQGARKKEEKGYTFWVNSERRQV